MKITNLGLPPQLPPNAGPYLQALDRWARELVRQINLASQENDTPTPYAYTVGTVGTSTLRTLTGTATSFGQVTDFLRTLTHDLKNKGSLR